MKEDNINTTTNTKQNNTTETNNSLDFNNLKDGTYNGTGKGRNGNIEVSVKVENNKVTDITIISSKEDTKYFNAAKSEIISSVIDK